MSKLNQRTSNKVCPEGMSIEAWQVALRREQAIDSAFSVEALGEHRIWGDYMVSSASGGRYKVAFRGVCSERNYCSCLDFRTNGLGTCKHLEAVTLKLQQEVEGYPWSGRSYNAPYSSVYVSYKGGRSIRMRIGTEDSERYSRLYQRYFNEQGTLRQDKLQDLGQLVEEGEAISSHFRIYDDVYDFAKELLDDEAWQRRFTEQYPKGRIPWLGRDFHEDKLDLEESLYRLSIAANGLVVAPQHDTYIQLALRLLIEIYKAESQLQASFIIVEDQESELRWRKFLRSFPMLASLPIQIVTEQLFIQRINSTHPSVCFVWVDNAWGLRDWKNELSLSLKKLSIAHLYMRVHTMSDVTPIQLSSTLQHISPYLLGALYRFVHKYRVNFPMADDGSNAPEEVKRCVFFCGYLTADIDLEEGLQLLRQGYEALDSEGKVRNLLSALHQVLDDPEALGLLKQHLHKALYE